MLIRSLALVVSLIFTTSAFAVAIDFSGVANLSPNIVNRAVGSTTFSGTLITDGLAVSSPAGQANGDLALGAVAVGTEVYRLVFAAPVVLTLTNRLTIPAVFFDDVFTLTSAGAIFTISDPGSADLVSITNGVGQVMFTGDQAGGDADWQITTSPLTTIDIQLDNPFNFTDSGSAINFAASTPVPEPSTLALMGFSLLGLALGFRRRSKHNR